MATPHQMIYIGLDGGGTKTALTAIDDHKKIVAAVTVESTNSNSVGVEKAKATLQLGIKDLLAKAHATSDNVGAIVLCMAGVDRPEDKTRVSGWVAEALPKTQHVTIDNDAVAALASGTEGHLFGVVVISGTGTISVGFDAKGERTRAAGWGPLLGDEGSGYAIAHDMLRCCVSAADGRGPQTSMLPSLMKKLNLEKAEQLIGWAYSDYVWARFAALATVAFEGAAAGDAVAKQVITRAAEGLLSSISAVVSNLHMENTAFPLVLAGGNLTHEGSLLTKQLTALLHQKFPQAKVSFPSVEPTVAAALLARNNFHSK